MWERTVTENALSAVLLCVYLLRGEEAKWSVRSARIALTWRLEYSTTSYWYSLFTVRIENIEGIKDESIEAKIAKNNRKYPVEKSKGNKEKYTEL